MKHESDSDSESHTTIRGFDDNGCGQYTIHVYKGGRSEMWDNGGKHAEDGEIGPINVGWWTIVV